MLRRARRVAAGKLALDEQGRPYYPMRLRDRDGLLTMDDIEGDGEVSLRGWTLTQILIGLGALDRDTDDIISVNHVGRSLRDRLG